MLESTFIHLDGYGAIKERQMWKSGVLNIQQHVRNSNKQLKLDLKEGNSEESQLAQSVEALVRNDDLFFSEKLPPSELYRLAAYFPNDTVFIDLETTGLSHYYDEITVIGVLKGNDFDFFIKGQSEEELRKVTNIIESAKCIVTFNGALFDLKFLRKEIPSLRIPKAHIDLRFFARRFGYSGGQKKTEIDLGISRNENIKDLSGEQAPLLWHNYKLGDEKSAKLLIEYNRADVLGMQHIFNDLIAKKVESLEAFPNPEKYTSVFFPRGTKFPERLKEQDGKSISVPKYTGKTGPTVTYQQIFQNSNLQEIRAVGIDLTGSENRPSGCALLDGRQVTTCLLKTDQEILEFCKSSAADIVSIDSPLSLPKGRTSAFDDDPMRDEFGIMRIAERILKKRGVNVYPSLIPSMQKLTLRGIKIAKELRSLGIPVIECYPGAAQDIMGIPRKQKGLEYLAQGLSDFGVRYWDQEQSKLKEWNLANHDELDAITSAVVAIFFWTGQFEAIGITDENLMIIPDLKRDNVAWLQRKVIGFSGEINAGKTTASAALQGEGFSYTRYSKILKNMLKDQSRPASREELQKFGKKINEDPGQSWLTRKVSESLGDEVKCVIDGLRFPEDHAGLIEFFGPGFKHVFVDSEEEWRFQRYISDKKGEDLNDKTKFSEISNHPVEKSSKSMKNLAHTVLENNGREDSFQSAVKQLVITNQPEEDTICQ